MLPHVIFTIASAEGFFYIEIGVFKTEELLILQLLSE